MKQGKRNHPFENEIHGLRQCVHCGRFWNRDRGAARDIGWVFVSMWLTGERPIHLRPGSDEADETSTVLAVAENSVTPKSISDRHNIGASPGGVITHATV